MPARRHAFSRALTVIFTALCSVLLLCAGPLASAQAKTPRAHSAKVCHHGHCHVVKARVQGPARSAKHKPSGTVTIAMTAAPVKNAPALPAPAQVTMPAVAASDPSPCDDGDLTPDPTNLPQVEAATVCLVNQVRAQHGLPALTVDPRLQTSAQQHNDDMVSQDYFAHVGPGGDSPLSRIQAAGYGTNPSIGYLLGENIAWGTLNLATPSEIVTAWVNSPEHLANILERTYTVTGLAVAPQVPSDFSQGQDGAIYTQDFGGVQQS
jgi:uncharacterized protein YkwD